MKPKEIKISEKSKSPIVDLALDTISLKKQALVFANTKRSAEKTAEDITKKLKESDEYTEIAEKIISALSVPTTQCKRLAGCIKKGVAFHHAGLAQKQRAIIEESFREGKIKIICSTPTLAAGLDLPAFRAIMKNLTRYGKHGQQYIPVIEYKQMAGRAGRPKFDSYGEAIILAETDAEEEKLRDTFIFGEPENIYSKLAVEPVFRTYLLSLIASDFVGSKKMIIEFFEETFWAHQFKDSKKILNMVEKTLCLLSDFGFIKVFSKNNKDTMFVSAKDLADDRVEATPIGKRVSELYIDPLTANYLIECVRNLKNPKIKVSQFSYLQMISHTLEMRPLLTIKTKEWDEIGESLAKHDEFILEAMPELYDEEYDEFLKSIKTALLFEEWTDEKDEEYLLERYDVRPGELHVKLDLAEWLLYSTQELSRILNIKEAVSDIQKARIRLQYGVREELLPLLKFKNIGRVRARKLFNNGIKDTKDVKSADIITLVQLIGKNIAIDIKKQVDQDYTKIEVKENKRKGQISLKDWC